MMDRFVAVVEPDVEVTWADGGVSRAYHVTQRSAFPLAVKFSGRHVTRDGRWEDFAVPLVPGVPSMEWLSVPEGGYLLETEIAWGTFMGLWEGSLDSLVEYWESLGAGHEIANIEWKDA